MLATETSILDLLSFDENVVVRYLGSRMPGKRKQVRTAWKLERKVQLAGNRRQKAIRLSKAKKSAA